jgi:hypothetical protein
MKDLSEKLLSKNRIRSLVICLTFLATISVKGQDLNLVSNGSFESLNSFSASTKYNAVEYWQSIDTGKVSDYLVTLLPPIANGPYALGFQYPRTGFNYDVTEFFNYRGYPRNRLKTKLKANSTYCARIHVVSTNSNPYGIGSIGMYFSDETLDTIEYCNSALSYLSPQIEHPVGNIITDTLNWIPISGTFVATGSEKYLVLGNFRTDANTQTLLINPTYSNDIGSVYCIDDVSCIEIDPQYAGHDTTILVGDSIFIGKYSDEDWIDVQFSWFSHPGMTKIDSMSGLWVKPATTATYIVNFKVCNYSIWDTIVIRLNEDDVRLNEIREGYLQVYPSPTSELLAIKFASIGFFSSYNSLEVTDALGCIVIESEIVPAKEEELLDITSIPNGLYFLRLVSKNQGTITKRFIVSR